MFVYQPIRVRASRLKGNRAFAAPKWPDGYVFKSRYGQDQYGEDNASLFSLLMRLNAAKVVALAAPFRGAWLEIGCGPGVLIPLICKQARIFVGLELATDSIIDAAALSRASCLATHVLHGDANFLPFKDGSLDGILCMETLEHVQSSAVMAEVLRVLKPSGRFIFSVPVESGTALLTRQVLRRILHISHPEFSPMAYSPREFASMVLGGDRDLHRTRRSKEVLHHLFFSYRACLDEIKSAMILERVVRVPLPMPGPWSFSVVGCARKKPLSGLHNQG